MKVAEYVSRHDLVYHSPPSEGWEAFPLGNGSLGGPLWTNSDSLIFQVNHTNAFEPPNPQQKDEGLEILRSCGRLTIRHAVPCYDWLYLNGFEGRLALGSATATMDAQTPFGSFRTNAYVHAGRPVAVFEHRAGYSAAVGSGGAPVRICLDRWGSRVFGWWYSVIQGDAGIGLGRCAAFAEGADAGLDLTMQDLSISLRCRIVGARATARVIHDHQVEIEIPAEDSRHFDVFLACVTSHESDNPSAAAFAAIEAAAQSEELAAEHGRSWGDFWQRSFLHLSDDYMENLYYLNLYFMGSAARGKFPPLFNGGLWTWNRDVRNWAIPHHWNEQQLHWSLLAANRQELLAPYLETYHRLMPEGQILARERGFDGQLLAEMHNLLSGRQLGTHPSMVNNFTQAAQVAMFFWWHYQFTGDLAFLCEKGYPYMQSAGDFYLSWIEWEESRGQYRLPAATTYEDDRTTSDGRIIHFTDSITNLAMIKGLFPALIQASEILDLDAERRARWRHVLQHLPPYQINERDTARGPTLSSGLVYGLEQAEKEDHTHGSLFCPIFPAGDLGLKDRGTLLFEAACHTLLTYPPHPNAITPAVATAARLGLADEAWRRLDSMVRNLQHFPNGLFFNIDHWFSLSRRTPTSFSEWNRMDSMEEYQRDYITDGSARFADVVVQASETIEEHRIDLPAGPFTQAGLETLGQFTAGLQEMFLQSHEKVIRVFPATPSHWKVSFTLMAVGGFEITAQKQAGQPADYVVVFSHRGGRIRLASPWQQKPRLWGGEASVQADGDVLSFETQAGSRYVLGIGGEEPETSLSYPIKENRNPKRYGPAILGKERNF